MQRNGTLRRPPGWPALAALALIIVVTAARPSESPLLAECARAMSTMNAAMMSAMRVTSRGDADADFVAVMMPHHEGAIAMAQAELQYGRNEQLRRLAQEIIVTQQQEIVAMRMAKTLPLSNDSPPRIPSDTPK